MDFRGLRAILALFALMLSTAPVAAGARVLRYHGQTVRVPAGWRVYDLARDPTLCVRLDRRAVYLGTPSAVMHCPARAIGRDRAIVIEPHGRRALVLHGARAGVPSGSGGIAGGASAGAGGTLGAGGTPTAPSGPGLTQAGTIYNGLGFDPCSAPTVAQMAAWGSSPYHAVGIYIGGTNMGCAQPNLNPAWVSEESAAGWHLIPTYVGLQAPSNSCGCSAISPGDATAQGVAAANDAVAHARGLGLGRGNPIYDDMEYYDRTSTNTPAVLAFLSGWTSQLHAAGYQSGVYGNSDSVIDDLITKQGTSYPEPDDIWFAEWNGAQSVSSPYFPDGFWVAHRLHQYSGGVNQTYAGVTINIDGDAIDGATAGVGSAIRASDPFAGGTFVQVSGTQTVYRIAGGAPLPVDDWTAFGGPQPYTVILKRQFTALASVPASGTFLSTSAGADYVVAGGEALPVGNPALFPGLDAAVTVDPWDIANPTPAHLAASPADGTIVEGLPSRTYWVFDAGARRMLAATSAATQVDDAALKAFRILPCRVPALRGLTVAQARTVLQAADCTLGKLRRRHPPAPHHFLHVIRQSPGANAKRAALAGVNLRLG